MTVSNGLRVDLLEIRMMRVLQLDEYPIPRPVADDSVYVTGLPFKQTIVDIDRVVARRRALTKETLECSGRVPENFLLIGMAGDVQRLDRSRMLRPGTTSLGEVGRSIAGRLFV